MCQPISGAAAGLLICTAVVGWVPHSLMGTAPGGATLEADRAGAALAGAAFAPSVMSDKFATDQFNERLIQFYEPLTVRTEAAALDGTWPRTKNISLGLDTGPNGTLQPGRFTLEGGPIQVAAFSGANLCKKARLTLFAPLMARIRQSIPIAVRLDAPLWLCRFGLLEYRTSQNISNISKYLT
eukprot:SAG31_NODE_204_length_20414_cov_19.143392_5_plen_183_part_00